MSANLTALQEFNAVLSRYIIWSQKGQGPMVEDRARKVRFELYRVYRKIAKTPQQLREEISELGFAFKRRADRLSGRAVSPEKEVGLRIKSLRYLSVSWIFKSWRARQGGQMGKFSAIDRGQKNIGEALVRTAEGQADPYVEITSFLAGVKAQNDKRKLVDEALRGQSADMAVYIARKHAEFTGRTLGGKTFNVSGEVKL